MPALLIRDRQTRNPALFGIAFLAVTAMTRPAQANVVIIAVPTKTVTSNVYTRSVTKDPPRESNAPPLPSRHPDYPIVKGFGTAIPIATALRLIVPPYVTVHFGVGVNREMPCSWRGGLPWPATLATALSPLGLHLSATRTTAKITIKKFRNRDFL